MSDIPPDLIPLGEACQRGPRPARGARRHRSTVLRWILSGQLRGWKVRRHWYVSSRELEALLRPEPAAVELVPKARARLEAAHTDEVLRREGVRR